MVLQLPCSCLATASCCSLALMEETPLMDRVNDLGLLGSEQSTRVCLRRKIILGLRYISVTVPLRDLPMLAGCVLVQPQLALLWLFCRLLFFISLRSLLLFSCSCKFSPSVSPSRFDFFEPSLIELSSLLMVWLICSHKEVGRAAISCHIYSC